MATFVPPDQRPALGYGKPTEASIDAVNQWMRAQPWYQAIRGTSRKLTDTQRKQILRAAQAQGVVVDEGDMEIDPAGNFNPKGHKLRNTLIVAGIAGATIATMGAAGAFAGAGGAAGSGAAAGGGAAATGAGGALASTTLGAGYIPAIAGGAGTSGLTAGAIGGGAAAAGGGAAANVAGAGAGAGGSWVRTALKDVLPVAGGLYGQHQQRKADAEAARIETEFLEKALEYEKSTDRYEREREANRYGELQTRLAPYLATGSGSNSRMAELMGLPAPPGYTPPAPAPPAPTFSEGTPDVAQSRAPQAMPRPEVPRGTSPTVRVQAPTGAIQDVPADQEEYWISKGAKRV